MTSQDLDASSDHAGLVTPERKLIEVMKAIYDNGVFNAQDTHEVNKVKQVTRKIIFPGLKFCRGEKNVMRIRLWKNVVWFSIIQSPV
mgnify:CR=1 FL=1